MLFCFPTVGAAVETYGYNAFGETTSRVSAWSGSNLYAATYTRDDLGRIATKTEIVQGVTTTYAYGYDARGRLATVHTNGTLTATWGYDPNGNLTTRTDSAGLTSYEYDLFGNLRRIDRPSGDVVECLIDGQNRRVGRVLNGAVTHKWLYKDQLNPVAELDAAGNVVARFIYGTTYHAPDVMLKGGATYRLITDHLGSVRLVVDVATGTVAQRLDYDEWGRVLVDTNPGFQPFGYAGGLGDPATGLVRFGARDYDAEVGRWTAKDPIRFAGGDENIYAYVGGDPVNLVDPGGLAAAALPLLICEPCAMAVAAGVMAIAGALALECGKPGKWSCTAQCNVQNYSDIPNSPLRVSGSGSGTSETAACEAAKRAATQSAPRGTYPRHCKCTCSKR